MSGPGRLSLAPMGTIALLVLTDVQGR
jgi:hypothetical protein